MSAHQVPQDLFGKTADTRPTIPLPYALGTRDKRCMVVIDSRDGRVTSASWFDIWQASTAVSAKCVRQGKAGRISNLGANGKMFVTILDE